MATPSERRLEMAAMGTSMSRCLGRQEWSSADFDTALASAMRQHASPEMAAKLAKSEARREHIKFATLWHDNGFPVVAIGHKQMAAFASTKPPPDFIRVPWSAFWVDLPSGAVPVGKSGDYYCGIGVHSFPHPASGECTSTHFLTARGDLTSLMNQRSFDESAFSGATDEDPAFASGDLSEVDRCALIMNRITCSICLRMNDTAYVGSKGRFGPSKRKGDSPAFRFYRLSDPVNVDCREEVRRYLGGEIRSPLTSQFLVRGHWRHQPCGSGQIDRRLQWIEPFWKGPEAAPINLRSHALSA